MGFGNPAKLMQQVQKMQADMARVEEELRNVTVEGSAGGGAVRAVVTGKQDLVSLTIDPSVVDPEDVDMLQDLVVAAITDAVRASRETAEQRLGAVTGGLQLPGLG